MLARYLTYLHWLRKNLHDNQSALYGMQFKRLKAVIPFAYENVPFYHRKFVEACIKPDDIKSFDDLIRLPLTTRREIQTCPLKDMVARDVDMNKCVKFSTSGSTGVPVTVFSERRVEDFSRALWTRAFLTNGLRITDRIAHIWNPLTLRGHKGVFRILRIKQISVFQDIGEQLEILRLYRPDVIRGYPSSLAGIKSASENSGVSIRPRLVFTGADLLSPMDRQVIRSKLNCEVFDYLGCGEFSLLMWDCPEHMGYHVNIDSLAMEFLSEGEAVSSGEEGEIVCSSLHNYVMPLIRYELGDVGVPIEEKCSCGIMLPLMKVVRGRSDDLLKTLDGKSVFASAFLYNLFGRLDGIGQFRVIQERRDRLLVQLTAKESFVENCVLLETVKKDIQKTLGIDMQVDFQFVRRIERDPTGKLRVFVSSAQ